MPVFTHILNTPKTATAVRFLGVFFCVQIGFNYPFTGGGGALFLGYFSLKNPSTTPLRGGGSTIKISLKWKN